MALFPHLVEDYAERFGRRLSLPEYRQLELYAQKRRVPFHDGDDAKPPAIGGLLGVNTAFTLLDAFLESQDESLDGKNSWDRYLALPRKTTTGKLVAEVFRILRIVRLASLHAADQIAVEDGVVKMFCTYRRCALTLNITPLGLDLLRSFVVYYLDSFQQPYGDAYVEAMLLEYFSDIVGEIKGFADLDRVLFQFRRKAPFCRTHRRDCETPRFTTDGATITFEISNAFSNSALFSMDIFVVINDVLHIIPVEALTGFTLPVAELPKWAARVEALPSRFRLRFGREVQVVGLPMT